MLVDLHVHSEYSEDAKPNASVKEVCHCAIQRGFTTIAFTDHKDFWFTKPPMYLDITAQRHDILHCQSIFSGQLEILSGVELGQIHATPEADEYVKAFDFDEVIGSLHVRRRNDIDIYFQEWDTINHQDFLREYFEDLLRMVQHGGFDILAHIDYPLRVMKLSNNLPTFSGWEAQIEPILREMITREIALEINTAGLFGWKKQVGPPQFILEMYQNLGGTMVTVGSDSHCAPDLGRGIPQAIQYAKAAGFHELVIFRKRKANAISI